MQLIEPRYFMLNCKYIGIGLSYEDYLLEIINLSRYFRSKSQDGSEYVAPKSEDNGECDANSTDYKIDFKLLVDNEMMNGLSKNRPTVNKDYIKQGIIIVNDNPSPTPIPKTNFLLSVISITEEQIKNKSFSNDSTKHFMKYLEKEKNLFLYYPYEYVGDKICLVTAFSNMLTEIFKIPLTYRKEKYPDKDTYVCIKVNENFLIFEWDCNGFVYRDSVNEALCPIYTDYKLYSFF